FGAGARSRRAEDLSGCQGGIGELGGAARRGPKALSRRVREKLKAARTRNAPRRTLSTVRRLVRHAATRVAKARLAFGQGTHNPVEEAILLVYGALGLPLDQVDPLLSTEVTPIDRKRVLALVDQRIRLRIPAAYLLKRVYLQGLAFFVDGRVIVPR